MKTIEFIRSTDPLFYYCNCTTFKKCPVDHSGTYVEISEAETALAAAKERIAELEKNLAAADKGLLKASDPNSGWQGINKECKLWQEKAEKAEAALAAAQKRERVLREALKNIVSYYNPNDHHFANIISRAALERKECEMDLSIITDLESERDKLRSELAAARERVLREALIDAQIFLDDFITNKHPVMKKITAALERKDM